MNVKRASHYKTNNSKHQSIGATSKRTTFRSDEKGHLSALKFDLLLLLSTTNIFLLRKYRRAVIETEEENLFTHI